MWLQTCKKKPFKNFGDVLRLEIGRKLVETDGSKRGFFRSGVTEACLNLDGKVP